MANATAKFADPPVVVANATTTPVSDDVSAAFEDVIATYCGDGATRVNDGVVAGVGVDVVACYVNISARLLRKYHDYS
jgi:hypothetical protein